MAVNEAAGTATITVTRTGGSDGAVSATVDTADGSAVAGDDYTAIVGGTVLFADGDSASKSIQVSLTDDKIKEPDEAFTVSLSSPTGDATLGNDTATVTIEDDDEPGVLAIDPASVTVNESAGTATITVTRMGGSDGAVSATVDTADGSAVAGDDYTAIVGGAVQFADGDSTSKSIQVTLADDKVREPVETFTVTISEPTGDAELGNVTGTVTIQDDDEGPDVIIEDSFEGPTDP